MCDINPFWEQNIGWVKALLEWQIEVDFIILQVG